MELILILSFFTTLLMGTLTFLCFRRHREKEMAHLTEFWASLSVTVLAYYLFRVGTWKLMALAMLGWPWTIITLKKVLQDMTGSLPARRSDYLILGSGLFLSFALGGYGFPFVYTTLPFSLAVGGIGLFSIYEATQKNLKLFKTPLINGTFILLGFLFLEHLTFPFWRSYEQSAFYAYALGLIIYVGLGGTSIASQLEIFKTRNKSLLDEMLKERNEKILGSSKYSELGMMAAGIAHEINNPLAVIQARTTQLLRIYRDTAKQQDLADGLQQILYTSERINRTIQGVREFVHQDEQGRFSEFNLKTIFDDVLVFTGQRMKNHGVNLRFYGLENFKVIGNKIQLEQIILNLLNNSFDAIEYLPDKWIEVSAHEDDRYLHIIFKDSGSGIPPEIASHMMEPFFTTKPVGKGTGLGLALARGIAEKHGGDLKYLEESPHTTFQLDLPRDINQTLQDQLH